MQRVAGQRVAGLSGRPRTITHRLQDGQDTSCNMLPCRSTDGLTLSSVLHRGHNRRASGRANASLTSLASSAE